MTSFFKTISAVLLTVALAACEGTGVRDTATISQSIRTAESNSVFLFRDTGFVGAAALLLVFKDGEKVGTIGVNESLELNLAPGTHTLLVRPTELQGIGTKPAVVSVTQDGSGPKYFVISLKQSVFSAEILMIETTRDSYLRNVE